MCPCMHTYVCMYYIYMYIYYVHAIIIYFQIENREIVRTLRFLPNVADVTTTTNDATERLYYSSLHSMHDWNDCVL